MAATEIRGLTHWFIINTGNGITAWNMVRDKKIKIIDDSRNIVSMAVDPYKGYLFLADDQNVWRHEFKVKSDQKNPEFKIEKSETVYQARHITALAVDQDHSLLYISCNDGILIMDYSPETLRNYDVKYGRT